MQPTKSSPTIESVIKYFSFIYVLLVTSGLTYNYFFYKSFGILISEYIELGEILLLFAPMLADTVVITFIFLGTFYYGSKHILFAQSEDPQIQKERDELKKFHLKMFYYFLSVIILTSILCLFGVWHYKVLYTLLLLTVVLFIPFLLELLFISLGKSLNNITAPIYRDVAYIFILLLSIVLFTSYSSAERIKRKGGYKKFEVSFNNGEPLFRSDSNSYYLGRTRNYFFIFDFKSNLTRVLNVKDIKEFRASNE